MEEPQIVPRELVDTEQAWLREARVPVSQVLSRLGEFTLTEVVRQFRQNRWGGERSITEEDVRACARFAFSAIQEGKELRPPARSALTERIAGVLSAAPSDAGPSVEAPLRQLVFSTLKPRSPGDFSQLAAVAEHQLSELAAGHAVDDHASWPDITPRTTGLALRFAATLIREGALPAAPDDEGTFFRDLLTPDVRYTVVSLSVYWSELADARLTPEVMYHRWKGTVEALESSYDFWKLQRALSARDALQDAISLVPPSARQSLIDLVAPLDDTFEVSTERVPSPSYGGRSSWKKASWWWYRIPRQRGPRLESDFGAPGLLPL